MIQTVLNKRLVMLSLTVMMSIIAFAQNLTGTVKDSNGEPIIGASVQVKGTSIGAVTDVNGKYSINGVKQGQTLVVSYVGYLTKNVKVGSGSENVTLSEDNQALDELVVVGYGSQRKADVTGATARVSAKELTAMPVKDALQGMQGKTAGVDIQNSQRPGEVGNIQVRGVRSLNADQGPLYVVDGMILQNGGIENINPQDIESIDVLKDAASTSVYGSRGANGVVLITTKHGKQGKLSVNYSGSLTLSWLNDVAEQMTASEWLDYARMAKYNSGTYKSTIGTDGKVVPVYEQDKNLWGGVSASWANIEQAWAGGTYNADNVGSYDWASNGKQTGVTQNHNLSFSGGTEKFQGYGSFGYLKQKGEQPGQEYERFTMKATVDAQVLPFLKLGTSLNGAYGVQDYGYSFTKSTTGAGDYYSALQAMLPWTVPYDENGDYLRNPNGDVNIINPIRELKYNTNRRKTFNINGNFYAHVDFGKIWNPLGGLSYRIQFGPEFKFYETQTFNEKDGINGDGNNKAAWNKYQYQSWVLDNIIQYNKTIAEDHHIGVTLLQSASKYHYDNLTSSSTGVHMDTEMWWNMASGTYTLGSGLTESSMASYMARINYNYADKYMLTASLRYDGASQLAEGHKWATFPSVSVAWRIDQEKFMEKTKDWLTSLKLRIGYGVSGNSAISAYATKGAANTIYYNYGQTNSTIGYIGSDYSAASPSKAANSKLSWERTGQFNLGLDFSFLNDRIYGSFDYYKTKTTDLLMSQVIPVTTGYTETYANVGSTVGHGFDIQLNAVPVKTKDFKWTIGLTWSADRAYIDELANGKTKQVNSDNTAWIVGEEIGTYYDYKYDGIWTTGRTTTLADGSTVDCTQYGRKTGQIKVVDINRDGKIDGDNDRCIVGKSRPDWTGGLTCAFTYKNWELSFFIYSRMGFDVKTGALTLDGRYMQRSINYFVAGYNENSDYYAPGINGESADTYQTSQNYQDGSYIKMRNINLGYNFKPSQIRKLGLSTLKVYCQVMNPFSLYRATDWLDCDMVSYANNTKTYGTTTTIRSFVFGLNIGF